MFDELLDLYDDYSDNAILADNRFVNQVFVIVNKYHSLGEYLKSVYVTNQDSEYRSIDKVININLDIINKIFGKLQRILSREDYVYLYNLVAIETIFHELEHVYQEELKFNEEFNIEKALLVLADPVSLLSNLSENPNLIERIRIYRKLKKHRRYYDKRHDRAPHERIANLRAYAKSIALINDYDIENDGIKYYCTITAELINKQLLNGYKLSTDKTNSPSIDYLIGMKGSPNSIIIDNSKDFFYDMKIDKKDRLLYGLELYKNEYLEILEKSKKVI